jgi:ribosomal protein L37AE/L43A
MAQTESTPRMRKVCPYCKTVEIRKRQRDKMYVCSRCSKEFKEPVLRMVGKQ